MNTEPEAPAFLCQPEYLKQNWETLRDQQVYRNEHKEVTEKCGQKAEIDVIPLANIWTLLQEMFSESWGCKRLACEGSWTLTVNFGMYLAESLEPSP